MDKDDTTFAKEKMNESDYNFDEKYYNPINPSSFSGQHNLLRATRGHITKKNVVNWLESQDAYTLHRSVIRKFPRRKYTIYDPDVCWEADLIDLRSIKHYNNNISYLLTVIDVFSKYAFVEPLVNKSVTTVANAFEHILKNNPQRRPYQLQTDKGSEFIGGAMQKLLKKYGIQYRVVRSPDVKAAIVERFNRTLKERLWRYFTYKNTKKYIDILQSVVHAYNHTKHRTIKMLPADVNLDTASQIRERMLLERKISDSKIKKPKYSVGALVRISTAKGVFAKGYEGGWSKELFTISKILDHRYPIVYVVKDLANEEIDGFFYEQELGLVRKNLETEEFQIDRVIRTKGTGSNKQVYVSWKGYPEKFNSWIPASNLTDI